VSGSAGSGSGASGGGGGGGSSASGGGASGGGSSGGGGGNWNPTPCETVIVAGAINHCLNVTGRTGFWDNWVTVGQQGIGVGSAIAGAASTIAGALTSTPPAYLAGAALLGANLVTNAKSLFSATPPAAAPSNMVSAAQSYASLYANSMVPNPPDRPYIFYGGLWNAAGAACPSNLLFGNFQKKDITLEEASNPQYFPVFSPSSSYYVSFTSGSYMLDTTSDKSKSNWNAIEYTFIAWHNHPPDQKFVISVAGQATELEMQPPNQNLAKLRTGEVMKALVDRGIPKDLIKDATTQTPVPAPAGAQITAGSQPG
jgi:hypothetical protein